MRKVHLMNTDSTVKRLVWLSITMLMLLASVSSTTGEERLVEGAMILAPRPGSDRMGEIAEDTLQACLARIPEQVTVAQRLMAQRQCREEETTRKLQPLVEKAEN